MPTTETLYQKLLKKEISHHDFYKKIADEINFNGAAIIERFPEIEQEFLENDDEFLNSKGLPFWDREAAIVGATGGGAALKKAGTSLSLATAVCVVKASVRAAILEKNKINLKKRI